MDILPIILPGFILAIFIVVMYEIELRKPKNKVHFYVARDKSDALWLYLNKPIRIGDVWSGYAICARIEKIGLNRNDYNDLKWEDEPVEVFLNLED